MPNQTTSTTPRLGAVTAEQIIAAAEEMERLRDPRMWVQELIVPLWLYDELRQAYPGCNEVIQMGSLKITSHLFLHEQIIAFGQRDHAGKWKRVEVWAIDPPESKG